MEEVTWELEATIRTQYPHLFDSGMNFKDKILLRGGKGGGGGGGDCNTSNYTLIVL